MGKRTPTTTAGDKPAKRCGRPAPPPVVRSTVPLTIDGGGIAYRVELVESLELGMLTSFDHDARTVRVRVTDDARELFQRLDHAATVVAEMAQRAAERRRRTDLMVHLEPIARLVGLLAPTRSGVRRAFGNAGLLNDGVDDFEPSMDRLEEARDALYGQSAFQQRATLNGWSPMPDRPAGLDVAAAHEDVEARRVAVIGISDVRADCDHECITQVGSFHDAVCVVIQEGTSKADALRHLANVERLVRDAWAFVVDESIVPTHRRRGVCADVLAGVPAERAIATAQVADGLPARVLFDGTTPFEPALRLLATGERCGFFTQIVTEQSIDQHGRTIRVGDVVVECDGGVIATKGDLGAGRVLAVAGSAVIYALGEGRGYTTATAGDCYIVARNEKSGTPRTPITPELGGNRSGEAKRATTAAA